MFERITLWLNRIACINIVSPRRAMSAFILAMNGVDINKDGELNAKELLKFMKRAFKELVYAPEQTDEELHAALTEILKLSK